MNSTYIFLNRTRQEPLFIGEDPRTQTFSSSMAPQLGDIATVKTVDESFQIRITSVCSRVYVGDLVATTNRHSYTPIELQENQSVMFTYAHIVSFFRDSI